MPTRLPLDRLLVPVRQVGTRVSETNLARFASALLFLPLAPSAADWQALPHAPLLRALSTHNRIDRLKPLLGFSRIDIFERRLLRHRNAHTHVS